MKIIRVIANMAARYGGPQTACVGLSEALAAKGHEVQVLTTNQDGDNVLSVPLGIPIEKNGVIYKYYKVQWLRFWSTSWGLGRALIELIPTADIVHVHNLYLFHTWLACSVARKKGIPYIVSPHGALMLHTYHHHRFRKELIERLYERRNLAAASAVHFVSIREQNDAESLLSFQRSFTIPWGVNLEHCASTVTNESFNARWPQFNDSRIILFLGRIHDFKGPDILLRSFRMVADSLHDVQLAIVGPGDPDYVNSLKLLAESLGISRKVTWCGMLTGNDKWEMLRRADICIVPSRVDSFGNTVLESMASGTPLVVSDQVGLCEEVRRSGAGLVTPVDPESVADAIRCILNDNNISNVMSNKGPLFITDNYDWSKRVLEFEKAYESLIQ